GGLEWRLTPSGHHRPPRRLACRRIGKLRRRSRNRRRCRQAGSARSAVDGLASERTLSPARGLAATPHGLRRRRRRDEAVLLRVRRGPVR
ncbi:unnamed protein product, partial [Ixodes hexagonus]